MAALASTIVYAYYQPTAALAILMAFALGDLLLYTLMPDVLVCYRCGARFRDQSPPDESLTFRLETAERYRQEHAHRLKVAAESPSLGPKINSGVGKHVAMPPDG